MAIINLNVPRASLDRLTLALENLTQVLDRAFPPSQVPYRPSSPTSPEEVSRLDLSALADADALADSDQEVEDQDQDQGR